MASLPTPPFIVIDGIDNLRDIGGYPAASPSGRSVRRNFIYRSADTGGVTDAGKSQLQALGLRHVYDLRSSTEVDRHFLGPLIDVPGIERHWTPVFRTGEASPEALAERFAHYLHGGEGGFALAYKEMLVAGKGSYAAIFRHIRDRPGEPLLFHCSAGKDRTGVLAMLILKLAGCSDETIAREYALTELGIVRLRPIMINHVLKNPNIQGADEQAALRMAGSRPESMLATLEMLQKDFGGVDGYLKKECQLTDEDLERVKANLFGDTPFTGPQVTSKE